MKKILLATLMLLFTFSLTGCSGKNDVVVPYKTAQEVKQEEAAKKIDEYNNKANIKNYTVIKKANISHFGDSSVEIDNKDYACETNNISIIKAGLNVTGVFVDVIVHQDKIVDFMFYDGEGKIIGNTDYSIEAFKDIPEPGTYEGDFVIASVSRELRDGKIGNQQYQYYEIEATDIKGRTIYFEYRIYSNTKVSTIYDMNNVGVGDNFKFKYDVRTGLNYGNDKTDIDYVITSFEKIEK